MQNNSVCDSNFITADSHIMPNKAQTMTYKTPTGYKHSSNRPTAGSKRKKELGLNDVRVKFLNHSTLFTAINICKRAR